MGFSNRYKSCNESCPLSVDGVYMLSFNIIMLLTNTHNIGVRTKMTIDEFVTSLEGTTAECAVDLGESNLLWRATLDQVSNILHPAPPIPPTHRLCLWPVRC